MWNREIEELGINLHFHSKAIPESNLLNGEIQPDVLKFAIEGNLRRLMIIKYAAQQITEAAEHLLRFATLLLAAPEP